MRHFQDLKRAWIHLIFNSVLWLSAWVLYMYTFPRTWNYIIIINTHWIWDTVPLKSKLPPSRETRFSSRETRVASHETRFLSQETRVSSWETRHSSRERVKNSKYVYLGLTFSREFRENIKLSVSVVDTARNPSQLNLRSSIVIDGQQNHLISNRWEWNNIVLKKTI